MILLPPQHGKSELVSHWLPAWFLGNWPDRKVILASYEHDFAASWGRKAREALEAHGEEVFGVTVKPEARAQDWWEIAGHEGAMFSAGAGGPITGKGADLIILDDLLKNTAEAMSETVRENVWTWYQMTVRSRLHDPGAIVLISTRWHADDIPGRLLKRMEEGGDRWEVLRFPAVAESEEDWGVFRRSPGEALCPALYTPESLRATERDIGSWAWATQYQQRPFARESGGFFARSWFDVVDRAPESSLRVRAWDQAATTDGDWTVGLRLEKGPDGETYYVSDVVRGRWTPGEKDRVMEQTARADGQAVTVLLVEDPGQAGKDQAEKQRKRFADLGYRVVVVENREVKGDKAVRAQRASAASEARRVKLVAGPWVGAFLSEAEVFPNGKHDDQIDALSSGFNWLSERRFSAGGASTPRNPTPDELLAAGINPGHWPDDKDRPGYRPDPLEGLRPHPDARNAIRLAGRRRPRDFFRG